MKSAPMLLVLGGASHTAGPDCLRQAADLGIDVWLTDTEQNLAAAPELVAAAARCSPLDFHDPAACAAWATKHGRSTRFLGVYGFREFAVESVAATAAVLGLPGNPVPAVRLVRDKYSCRTALAGRGFPQPAVARCASVEDARAFLATHQPGPWITKPSAEMGSTGLSLIRGADELGDAIDYLTASCSAAARERSARKSAGPGRGGAAHVEGGPAGTECPVVPMEFLIEAFQRGAEYSAEGIFIAGKPHVLIFTAKKTSGAPHFVETGHRMPAPLRPQMERAARDSVCRALDEVGLVWGVFHVEFWVDRNSIVLGELHARPGGDYIHLMTQLVTGVKLHGAIFSQLLGRPLDPGTWRPRGGAAVQYLSGGSGTLTAITGWDQVVASEHCVRAELTVAPGQRLQSATSSAGRAGLVVAHGASAEEAAARAAGLAGAVRFEIAPLATANAGASKGAGG